ESGRAPSGIAVLSGRHAGRTDTPAQQRYGHDAADPGDNTDRIKRFTREIQALPAPSGRPSSVAGTAGAGVDSKRIMARCGLNRDPAGFGELLDGRLAAKAAIAGGLHAAEGHLCLIMYRRAVDVTDAAVDAPGHIERLGDVAAEYRCGQSVVGVVSESHGLV